MSYTVQQIIDILTLSPGLGSKEIASRLGIPKQTLNKGIPGSVPGIYSMPGLRHEGFAHFLATTPVTEPISVPPDTRVINPDPPGYDMGFIEDLFQRAKEERDAQHSVQMSTRDDIHDVLADIQDKITALTAQIAQQAVTIPAIATACAEMQTDAAQELAATDELVSTAEDLAPRPLKIKARKSPDK